MSNYTGFGERLKKARLMKGYKQTQLATMVGISSQVISLYEIDARLPSHGVLIKLAAALHVSTDYLLGTEKKPALAEATSVDISALSKDERKIILDLIRLFQQAHSILPPDDLY
ncbi:MAG: helix-turn-helix domain-containing protein [Clostridiales bacterium]|nr:helix-turn-helix domain-containing protein [Clostridiales bacterium]